ncbi:MAG: ABC transporter ATP-binding protein [Longimonas sp.]|uniref:ABC transporter ATP-binding protein n=1 Tax=Longimonas sp. TaxID=2039626 RepID=UPI0039763D58
MPVPAIHVNDVSLRYDRTQQALQDVDLSVPQGALMGLLGPNGSGKTSLFRILATLVAPTEGTAKVFGASTETNAAAVRQRLGVVFQSPALDDTLTIRENLAFQGALYGLHGAALRERINTVLRHVELTDRAHDAVDTLSGGLARRADLARGLLHQPDLLLLDEPTAGLDPMARRSFWETVNTLQATEGTTMVVATHLMDEAERCDAVAILSEGELVVEGKPATLRAALGDEMLWLATEVPHQLARDVNARFGGTAHAFDQGVQLLHDDAAQLVGPVYTAFGNRIQSATVRPPTLEDVFMAHAGTRLDADRASLAPAYSA